MKPALPLHRWPSGRYVKAIDTDIRLTFERVRRELAQKEATVTPLKRTAK